MGVGGWQGCYYLVSAAPSPSPHPSKHEDTVKISTLKDAIRKKSGGFQHKQKTSEITSSPGGTNSSRTPSRSSER